MTGNDWIDVKESLPEKDKDDYSPIVYIKCNGRRCMGYYDHYLKSWFRIFKDILTPVKVTQWKPITPPPNKK